jgi:hypothetical protein
MADGSDRTEGERGEVSFSRVSGPSEAQMDRCAFTLGVALGEGVTFERSKVAGDGGDELCPTQTKPLATDWKSVSSGRSALQLQIPSGVLSA